MSAPLVGIRLLLHDALADDPELNKSDVQHLPHLDNLIGAHDVIRSGLNGGPQ